MEKRRDVIFGAFSPSLTNKDKEEAWKEVQKDTSSEDALVLSILGKESAVLRGIGSAESSEQEPDQLDVDDTMINGDGDDQEEIDIEAKKVQSILQGRVTPLSTIPKPKRRRIDEYEVNELQILKQTLLAQQIENEKLQSIEIRQNISGLAAKEKKDLAIAMYFEQKCKAGISNSDEIPLYYQM
uniref:Uncharacterized protein n=1 Tax=Romanomermis culicivorax TaxID=13658 RepID=A0A915KAS2_ROMCU